MTVEAEAEVRSEPLLMVVVRGEKAISSDRMSRRLRWKIETTRLGRKRWIGEDGCFVLKREVPPEGGWCYGMIVLIGTDTMVRQVLLSRACPCPSSKEGGSGVY